MVEKIVKNIIKTLIMLLITLVSCDFMPHETEGRYLVNHINADRNRNKSDESYFYADNYNIYRYSFCEDETEVCVQSDQETGYVIDDYAVYEDEIYYIKKNGTIHELCCMNYKTGNEEVLLSNSDIARFNAGNELDTDEYFCVDAYNGYLFFAIGEKYEYMCPIDGDIKTDSFSLNSLFESEGEAGDIQRVVYDGIVVERDVVWGNEYKICSIRDTQGYKILYSNIDPSIWTGAKQVRFLKDWKTNNIRYQVDDSTLQNTISIFQDDEYKNSHIDEDYLTIEDGKIIGLLSVSRHWAEYLNLYQFDLEKDVLFELDLATGKSKKLYGTRTNLTKIIGYQDGILYLVKREKVYKRDLETGKETALFDLPKGKDYIIDWQADYLIIREEFSYGQNGEIVKVYEVE